MKNACSVTSLLLSLLFAAAANAQIINIDKTDTAAYVKKAVWNGNISLGGEVDKQKSTLFDASNFLDVSLQKCKELYILSGSERFTYNGANSFLNKGYIHLRWRHNYKEQLHPESFVQYQWDDGLGMVHRFVAGENLRYNFWHRQLWELTMATGIMYEGELWNYTAVDSSKIPAQPVNQKSREFKSNNYVKLEGDISPVSKISIIVFYQAAFNDFFRPRISGVVNFNTAISKHFALGIQYNGLYDAGPVVPIFKFYYNYSSSLLYKF
jgi:opacity protein-like surface antigen